MAIDRISLWRTAPSAEIALDNELFLEAQQSQFAAKDLDYTAAAFTKMLTLRVTQPSFIVGSLTFSTSPVELSFIGAGGVAGYHITYTSYNSSNSGVEHNDSSFGHTITTDTKRCFFTCKISPLATSAYIDMSLTVKGSTAGKLLAGSFIKIF